VAPVAKYVKKGLSGVSDLLTPDPLDRLVRHVGGEVVIRIVRHLHLDLDFATHDVVVSTARGCCDRRDRDDNPDNVAHCVSLRLWQNQRGQRRD
jgi:hypothetical protein